MKQRTQPKIGNAISRRKIITGAAAVDDFPKTEAKLNAAFYTRVFDAGVAEAASRGLQSPYYT